MVGVGVASLSMKESGTVTKPTDSITHKAQALADQAHRTAQQKKPLQARQAMSRGEEQMRVRDEAQAVSLSFPLLDAVTSRAKAVWALPHHWT